MALVDLFRGLGPFPAGACGALSDSCQLSPCQGPEMSPAATPLSAPSLGLHSAEKGCSVCAWITTSVGIPAERTRGHTPQWGHLCRHT